MIVRQSYEEEDLVCMSITSGLQVNEPVFVTTKINGKGLRMEIDSGSAVSVLIEEKYLTHFNDLPLLPCKRKLSVVNGARLNILGYINVCVSLNNVARNAMLVVLEGCNSFIPLIG